jgi:hypothetical protein
LKTSSSLCARAFFQEFSEAKRIGFVVKKGTIADAVAGNDTIIHRAFGSHLKPVIFQLPEIYNDDEEADLASPARGASPTLLETLASIDVQRVESPKSAKHAFAATKVWLTMATDASGSIKRAQVE